MRDMVDEVEYQNHVKERVKGSSNILSEIVLGGQDGLVNTLGVVLGITAATTDIRIILAGALAAAFAESISMAAVAYTSKQTEYENYISEHRKELEDIKNIPEIEKEEIRRIFKRWGIPDQEADVVVDIISKNENAWVEIMMAHELELSKVSNEKPFKFAFTVGTSAIIGSLIPVIPILFLPVSYAWIGCLVISALSLLVIGYVKTKLTIGNPFKGALKLMIIGIVSAIAGYLIGYLIGG
ncbi:MAG: VIT1/CCC1 transporter family protein [Brevinematales bacterium]|nr:VIT1/CCC1 transporter family protein [Brevinematales bacterium]